MLERRAAKLPTRLTYRDWRLTPTMVPVSMDPAANPRGNRRHCGRSDCSAPRVDGMTVLGEPRNARLPLRFAWFAARDGGGEQNWRELCGAKATIDALEKERAMNDEPTLRDIRDLIDGLAASTNANFERLEAKVDARFDQIDTRFDQIDTRLDAIERKFDRHETRIEALEAR